jgi:hypothetical protein
MKFFKIKMFKSPENTTELSFTVEFTKVLEKLSEQELVHGYTGIAEKVKSAIAQRYVEENYNQIISELDTKALANLVLAGMARNIVNNRS